MFIRPSRIARSRLQWGWIAVSLVACAVAHTPAFGQTLVTWTGGGSNNVWTTTANWSGGAVPANGNGLVFAGSARTQTITGMSGSFASLAFTNTGTSSFIITGSGTLGGNITTANATTFLLDQLNSNLTLATTSTVSTGSNHWLTLGGSLDGGGGITKSGLGTLTLSGSNTFSGTTTINQGVLVATSANALPGYDTASRFSVASGAVLSTGTGWGDAALSALLNTGKFNSSNYFGFDSTAGARTYSGNLSGSINVAKTGLSTNAVTLSGTNTYSGTTAVMQGVLVVSSTAALPGYNTAGRFTVANGATLAVGNAVDDTAVAAILATGTNNFSAGGNFGFDTSAGDRTYSATISGAQGLTKTGSGKLTLAATNTYTGATNIDSGTLAFAADQNLGQLVFGSVVSATSATVGAAEFSLASGTFTSLTVQTNSSGTNVLAIGSGRTVAVNGPVSIGYGVNTINGQLTSKFAATGNGTFVNTNAGGMFVVGSGSSLSSGYNAAVADFSGLATMRVDLGATGLVQIGDVNGSNATGSASTDLLLAASSTITSGTLLIGGQQAANMLSRLLLGSGSTVLNVNRIAWNGASSRANTTIEFQSASGSLVLRAADGVGRAAIDVGFGSTNSTSVLSGTMNLGDRDVDLKVSTLSVGGTTAGGVRTGTFSYNRGSLDATAIVIGVRAGGSGTSTGFVTIGGGTTTTGSMTMAANTSTTAGALANATFSLSGGSFTSGTGGGTAINMANAVSGRTATSTINLTGGTAAIRGDIVRTGGAGTENATILLDGGSLDLGGYSIGSGTAAITLTAQRGALSNLGQLNGGGEFVKTTSGTLTLTGASSFTGATSVREGVVRFNSVAASAGAQALGAGSTVNLGVTATSTGEIDYFGSGGTLDKNVFALGNGRNRIRNSGAGTLELSGTLKKDGTILELAQGRFTVSGQITGTSPNSDLYINNATVTLSNTNNDYNGPTYVYGGGSLVIGASNVIPNGSSLLLGGTGGDTGAGTLDLQTFTESIAGLTFGAGGGTVKMAANQTSAAQLISATSLSLGAGTTLDLTGMQTTAGLYRLISGASLSGTFATVTGLDANYVLRFGTVTAHEISAQRKADQAFTLTTGTVTRALVNTAVGVSGSITNSTFTGGTNLAVSLSSGDGLAVGNFSAGATSIAPQVSAAVQATIQTGSTAGTRAWSVINSDPNAIQTTSTASGVLQVVNQRSFSVSNSGTINLGNFLRTATVSGSAVISSSGSNAITANASLGAFSGGPSGFALSTTDPTAFNGGSASQMASYVLSGSAASAGAINGSFTSSVTAELGSISPLTVSLVGSAYDPATALLASGGSTSGNDWIISLGEFNQGSGTSTASTFAISNLLASTLYTADLVLDSFSATQDSGAIFMDLSGTSFATLVAGNTRSYSAWMSLANPGAFTNTYQLTFKSAKDGQVLGGSQNVTLTVTGVIIVPEPDTIIFASIGIAMAGWSLRNRRRIARIAGK